VVVALLTFAAAAYWLDLGERWGISADPQEDPAAVAPPAGLDLPEAGTAGAVAEPLVATALDPREVRAALGQLPDDRRLGRRVAIAVADGSGNPSVSLGPGVVIPASTLKILTSVAAVEALGPEHRFTTAVTVSGKRLTLVGGGDPLLTRKADPDEYPVQADLVTLARSTAEALREEGTRRVLLGYDTSLFSGPAENPAWKPDYVPEEVSPIVALWVDEGQSGPAGREPSGDPAADAAQVFAGELRKQGIAVRGRPTPATGLDDGQEIASVESAELVEIVQHLLETSDNNAAEVLARHVAIAGGRPGSSVAAAEEVTSVLSGLGVDMRGAELYDGSGLSRDNRVPVRALVDALAVSARPGNAALAGVVEGLPVAGFTGSLSYRFATLDGASEPGLGRARLKTGTLTGVHGYAGVVVGRDGSVMLLVAVADRVRVPQTLFARDQLDRIAAALAACACSAG
jgi:serine-type D-Ala-D-Ala carboxypeptidase/endopeptidase (penicillin-binding protein 4)